MRKFKIIILLPLILFSCELIKEEGIDVEVVNHSDGAIHSLRVLTTEKVDTLNFGEVSSGQEVSGFLSMRNCVADGSYVLEFLRANGRQVSLSMGYYTNGFALDEGVRIDIQQDTVLIDFLKEDY